MRAGVNLCMYVVKYARMQRMYRPRARLTPGIGKTKNSWGAVRARLDMEEQWVHPPPADTDPLLKSYYRR
jgi:hypothetical protein